MGSVGGGDGHEAPGGPVGTALLLCYLAQANRIIDTLGLEKIS